MLSARLLLILLVPAGVLSAQPLSIVFKKHQQTVERYWTGSVFAFQLETGSWEKGQVMQLTSDSFYLRPFTIKYTMTGPDTTFYGIDGYALTDVYALPKPGYLVEYYGAWTLKAEGGHVHWLWIKNGTIFQILGLGYIGLQTLNGAIKQDLSLKSNAAGYGIGAAVAALGFIMKKTYRETRRIGKVYQLAIY